MSSIRKALIRRLMDDGLTRRQAEAAYRSIWSNIGSALASGKDVTLRGFGRFSTKFRPFHWRQIPRDREIVRIPDRTHVVFAPGSALRAAADASPDDGYFDAMIARKRRSSRQLLSQPEHNPLHYETQFDLGIAYREMGQIKDAFAKFHAALSLLDKRERGARFVRCCYLIAMCHKDIGDFELAAQWLEAGLASPKRPAAERFELEYQLGVLLGMEGKVEEALDHLAIVCAVNPAFRDAAEHMRSLQALRFARTVHG